jgi:hypothetical protein
VLLMIPAQVLAADSDGDSFDDELDNCVNDPNPNQRDSDNDGAGNVCDPSPFPAPMEGAIDASGFDIGGPFACHIYTLRIPAADAPPVGDTLPRGQSLLYKTGIFDTGSTLVAINGIDAGPSGSPSFGLGLLEASVPSLLDIRIWGLQAVDPVGLGAPLDFPEAEVPTVKPRILGDSALTLIGAPVANQVVTYIDYTTPVSRNFTFPVICAEGAAVSFFPDVNEAPAPLFSTDLEAFGATGPSIIDGATLGQRWYMTDMRFVRGSNVAEAGTLDEHAADGVWRVLYDTGTRVTQVTTDFAEIGLGIDLLSDPVDATLGNLNGYRIDKMEIDANDGSRSYVLENPLVFVRRPASPGAPPDAAFGGAADAILGSDTFQTTQVLIDGPSDQLGLFAGVASGVPFANFVVERARVKPKLVHIRGRATLGADSDGVDPLGEDVSITFDGFTRSIPAGSFRGRKAFHFRGKFDGARLIVVMQLKRDGELKFAVLARRLDVSGVDLSDPVPFALRIGDDFGETEISFDNRGRLQW